MTLTWMGEVWHVGAKSHDNAAKEKRTMHDDKAIWSRKGATLSDKSARQEFGLTQDSMLPPSLVCGRQIGAAHFASRTCT